MEGSRWEDRTWAAGRMTTASTSWTPGRGAIQPRRPTPTWVHTWVHTRSRSNPPQRCPSFLNLRPLHTSPSARSLHWPLAHTVRRDSPAGALLVASPSSSGLRTASEMLTTQTDSWSIRRSASCWRERCAETDTEREMPVEAEMQWAALSPSRLIRRRDLSEGQSESVVVLTVRACPCVSACCPLCWVRRTIWSARRHLRQCT